MSILSPKMCRACVARLSLALGLLADAAALADDAPHAVATDGPPTALRDVELEPGEPGDPPVRPLPPHLRAIQESLGGPVIEQFDSLEAPAAAQTPRPWWQQFRGSVEQATDAAREAPSAELAAPTWGAWSTGAAPTTGQVVPARATAPSRAATRRSIVGLRAAAIQLESAANRLEELELYRHADAIRQQAQRMRLEARHIGAIAFSPGPAAPGPDGDRQNPPESGRRRPLGEPGWASASDGGPVAGEPPPSAIFPMEAGESGGDDSYGRSGDDERSVLIGPRAE